MKKVKNFKRCKLVQYPMYTSVNALENDSKAEGIQIIKIRVSQKKKEKLEVN
jgi:hypothetical protein